MTDREKVIKELEECLSASCRGFRTCPYSDVPAWDAVREALALLKEQEPMPIEKEPIPVEVWDYEEGCMPQLNCPKCNVLWMSYRVDTHYCPNCGRRVRCDD